MIKKDVFQHYNIDFDNYNNVYIPNMSLCTKSKTYKGRNATSFTYGAFDTETSYIIRNNKNDKYVKCWVNSWQLALCKGTNIYSYQGRDIRTFALFIGRILNLDYNKSITIRLWVHNLAYDLEYIFQTLKMYYEVEIFTKNPHDYLYMKVKGENTTIEFLDSFSLMPKSLGKLCNDYDVFHKKKDNYDYKKRIYSDTPLTDDEIIYDMYDVYALCEIIQGYMDTHPLFNSIDKIPYTQTGQIRKHLENEFKKNEDSNRGVMYDLKPSFEEYMLLKNSYTGGITHCNTVYANRLVYVPNGEIIHIDIKSSYPYAIMSGLYPLRLGNLCNPDTVTMSQLHNDFYIAELLFINIRSKTGFPSLSISNCQCTTPILDNGKIVKADTCYTCITSIDFKVLNYCYDYDNIKVVKYLKYDQVGNAPEWIRNKTMEFFTLKENVKRDTIDDEINYMIAKENLNSIYGCCASAIDHTTLLLDDNVNELEETTLTDETINAMLSKHYKNKYIPYLAPFITAYARLNLYRGIATVGAENVIYTDTDSLFIKADNDSVINEITEAIEKLNIRISNNGYSCINRKGKQSTLGVWEFEDRGKYNKFVSLHAKAYCMGKDTDIIQKMTLCGVTERNKRTGVTREEECKTFDNFMSMNAKGKGFTFTECGGVTCGHNYDTPHVEDIEGHLQWVASGGIILDTIKQISFNENENFIATQVLNNSILSKDKISIEEILR